MNNNIAKYILPVRKRVRLLGFDYSSCGAYYITVCTNNKELLFGKIENGIVNLNSNGEIVHSSWKDLPNHYNGINNDIFIVMHNHVHGIIMIHNETRRSGLKPDPTKKHPLSEIVRAFKTYSSRNIHELRHTQGTIIWQHGYYEHIIRDENEYSEIGEYIMNNPAKWENDKENPTSS